MGAVQQHSKGDAQATWEKSVNKVIWEGNHMALSRLVGCNPDSCNEAEPWSQQLLRIPMNAEARGSLVQSCDADEYPSY